MSSSHVVITEWLSHLKSTVFFKPVIKLSLCDPPCSGVTVLHTCQETCMWGGVQCFYAFPSVESPQLCMLSLMYWQNCEVWSTGSVRLHRLSPAAACRLFLDKWFKVKCKRKMKMLVIRDEIWSVNKDLITFLMHLLNNCIRNDVMWLEHWWARLLKLSE